MEQLIVFAGAFLVGLLLALASRYADAEAGSQAADAASGEVNYAVDDLGDVLRLKMREHKPDNHDNEGGNDAQEDPDRLQPQDIDALRRTKHIYLTGVKAAHELFCESRELGQGDGFFLVGHRHHGVLLAWRNSSYWIFSVTAHEHTPSDDGPHGLILATIAGLAVVFCLLVSLRAFVL